MTQSKKSGLVFCLVFCSIAYGSAYIARETLAVLSTVMNDYGYLSTAQYGIAGALFFGFYAFGRLINGVLSDHVRPHIMIGVGVMIGGLCNIAIGLVTKPVAILVLWTINAIGLSMPWSSIIITIVNRAPAEKKGTYLTLIGNACPMGLVVGMVLSSKICSSIGLKYAFIIPGLITLIAGLLAFIFIRPEWTHEDKEFKLPFKDFAYFLTKDKDVRGLVIPCMVNGCLKDGINQWLIPYIILVFGMDISNVAGFGLFVPLLSMPFRFTMPPMLKRVQHDELKLGVYLYAATIGFIVLLLFVKNNLILTIVAFVFISGLSGNSNMCYVGLFPSRYDKTNQTGIVCGLIDALIYLGSAVFSLVMGYVVDRFGFEVMFIAWLICSLISLYKNYQVGKRGILSV